MDLTITLSAVEADALQTAYPELDPATAIHLLIEPVVQKGAESRLQRLASDYRDLTPDDQLEVATLLAHWKATKEAARAAAAPPQVAQPEGAA